MVPKKGLNTIFRVARRFSPAELEITFVGEGPHAQSVEDFSREFPLVKYVGPERDRERLAELYRSSHLLLLPSQKVEGWQELFGLVVIEAMSCGVIPITTDHVGPRDIIENKKSGYYFDEEQYVSSTAKLINEMRTDPEIIDKVSENALIRAKIFHTEKRAELWSSCE